MTWAADPKLAILEMLNELTRPHVHRERIEVVSSGERWQRTHTVRVAPLLVQLDHADPDKAGGDQAGAGFASKPAAHLEALGALLRIDQEASRWLRVLTGEDLAETIDCVAELARLAPRVEWCVHTRPRRTAGRVSCCTRHQLEADVRRWWTQARVVTGWDRAPWSPDNTCPMCGTRGSLMIRLEDRAGFCTKCHETWGPDSYQALADHIRVESAEERRRRETGACGRVEPRRESLDLMCPKCGSAQCVNAVRATKRRTSSGEWEAV